MRDSWVSNFNSKNLDGVLNLYGTDAVYLAPDGTRLSGPSEIRAFFSQEVGSKVGASSKKIECSGDLAYESGTYRARSSIG
jgi:ketosteroid isomerase-like protein